MSLEEPTSTNDCVYFTNRADENGKEKAWVLKEQCPECNNALMGKPRDEKTGKAKIRATEYVCPSCKYTVGKAEYEDTLTINIKYTCKCGNEDELSIPFKRKRVQRINEETGKKQAIETIRFECGKCGEQKDITKKMK
ncbi:MAG: hypothetical protein CMH64_03300 [Nanoarchaeota archaeon]|nr:hypothetical protein [Nanoarchaeota archaeon]|tara:strand:+ start:949 stop:1362 length:414 start_codon:yes stop_codon:yes gene_type:complete